MTNLILENQNLIYSIANRKEFDKYKNKEDLFQVGCIGMIKAYKNFDKTMNVKFTTYAYLFILGEMKKLVREDKLFKVPKNIQLLYLKIEKMKILLEQELLREPSICEIKEALENEYDEVFSYECIEDAINSTKQVYSLDEPLNNEGREITLQDTISNIDSLNLDDLISLKEEINKLTETERLLIEKRYINDFTQQQTAQALGISQVQVSRCEQKVLSKLKSKLI